MKLPYCMFSPIQAYSAQIARLVYNAARIRREKDLRSTISCEDSTTFSVQAHFSDS